MHTIAACMNFSAEYNQGVYVYEYLTEMLNIFFEVIYLVVCFEGKKNLFTVENSDQ